MDGEYPDDKNVYRNAKKPSMNLSSGYRRFLKLRLFCKELDVVLPE